MATLTVIAGLPGSGKTTLIEKMKRDSPSLGVAESDYMKNSINNSSELSQSRHHLSLEMALREGLDCVIADIVFVTQANQEKGGIRCQFRMALS